MRCLWCFVAVKQKCHLPLRIQSIDCHVIENATRHITKQYEQTKQLPRKSCVQQDVSDSTKRPSDARHSDSAQQRVSALPRPSDPQRLSAQQGDSDSSQQRLSVQQRNSESAQPRVSDAARPSGQGIPDSYRESADLTADSQISGTSQPKSSSQQRVSAAIQQRQSTHSTDSAPRDSAHRFSAHPGYAHLMSAFESSGPQLVLRRGQKFTIELACDRPYDRARDDIIFTFHFGKTRYVICRRVRAKPQVMVKRAKTSICIARLMYKKTPLTRISSLKLIRQAVFRSPPIACKHMPAQ